MASVMEISVLDQLLKVEEGTTFLDLAKQFQPEFSDDIALAKFNGKLQELRMEVRTDGELEFLTTKSSAGRNSYRRSVTMLMQRALYNINPKLHVEVCYSISQGFFCKLYEDVTVSEKFLENLKREMEDIVEKDLPIVKTSYDTAEAMTLFKEVGMHDKGNLFKYRSSSKVNVYSIGHYVDYYYGYMMPSTGYLKYFDLVAYDDGFVLMFPNEDTHKVADFQPPHKLYATLKESSRWGEMLGVANIGQLNDAIAAGHMQDIILVQEALMEKKIAEIANQISESGSKFVMIAGPSSSGKTSFSHRLSIQLIAQGLRPHPIGLDNYYGDRRFTPVDENGNPDFECLEALDVEQFNTDMQRLLKGEEVEMPSFNFKTGKREYRGNYLKLGEDDILVIEGIHGLNDKLSYSIDSNLKFKIYISALTQLNIDEHNCLHTTDGRLLRRIVRDARTRGTSAKETIAMWYSVRRGEEKYIFPHQEQADAMFNSAFLYELAVIKPYVQPLLYQISPGEPEYDEAKRLLKLLDYILPVPSEDINRNSLFREFIGGSCFNV
ncbi:uridine kinase [Lachnospiraceae bacterium XBB1006]|nr:uridine kinase [Lachnospiraceae bacterium XBB1006]